MVGNSLHDSVIAFFTKVPELQEVHFSCIDDELCTGVILKNNGSVIIVKNNNVSIIKEDEFLKNIIISIHLGDINHFVYTHNGKRRYLASYNKMVFTE